MSQAICSRAITPEYLSAWRSRLLPPDEANQLAIHISICPACQAVLADFERIAQAVRTPPPMPSGQEIWRTMSQRINQSPLPRISRQQQLLLAGGLGAIALVILFVFLFLSIGSPNVAGPTPTALLTGTANVTAVTTGTVTGTTTPSATGTPAAAMTPTTPAANRPYIYIDAGAGTIEAINPTTNQIVWHHDNTTTGVYSQPIIVNGVVYAAYYADDPTQASVYAFNAQNGSIVWHTAEHGSYTFFATENGVIFGRSLSAISAWSMADGHMLWTSAAIVNGQQYTYSEKDGIIAYFDHGYGDTTPEVGALDAATGIKKWSITLNTQDNVIGLATGNGAVYIYENTGYVSALAGSDGHQLWHVQYDPQPWQTTAYDYNSMVYDNGLIYVAGASDQLGALDARTGASRWAVQTMNSWVGLPTIANGVAYLAASDMYLYAINVNNGALLWSKNDSVTSAGQPIVSDGWVYVYGSSGIILAYTTASGTFVWSDYSVGYGIPGIEP
jgi:outer membrane protein assembly factor BamB